MGTNPEKDSMRMDSSFVFPEQVALDCEKLFSLGKEKYDNFFKTRFILGFKEVILTEISRNALKLAKDHKSVYIDSHHRSS